VRAIAENLDVPEEFTLILSTGRPRLCRLAWRIGCEFGAQFIDPRLRHNIPLRGVARGHRNMRKAHSALFAFSLALAIVPDIAAAGGAFVVAPGFRGIAHVGGYGYARPYGHPFDDGYDYPLLLRRQAENNPDAGYSPCWRHRTFAAKNRIQIATGY
jgi:hypothetical protein